MKFWVIFIVVAFFGCHTSSKKHGQDTQNQPKSTVSLYILGTVQDGGSPHIGCKKECCSQLFENPDPDRKVVSLGVVDHETKKTYLFEASPDITSQLKELKKRAGTSEETPNGILLTHAHIGHYSGLMYLGREALGAQKVPVYAMPKMENFLRNNGPWNQLVDLGNIQMISLVNESELKLSKNFSIVPFTVPHRDEYSETVGYKLMGPNQSTLFIPDIDKWSKWEKQIVKEIESVDLAFLDATFFSGEEIDNRDISEIPHPFVIESIELFKNLPETEKAKIHFIHFNHTNPLLNPKSDAHSNVIQKGFGVASLGQQFEL
ncbi:MBL fold metallo-hydrolase [Flagellimonas allohymeniacidonis]|uniref:MBL fold metallo-hydrolase n=1 Tax=Flagellimonas allohymeniacidonis TaxID=2517819 RepID=A0A4V2HSY2_9FLAO|nr:MBL fold metallo-hydrolase [Allomuricauda hymeniacidonis]TAI49510.1 MBL fold metallo-hydrolase [Allomuricauda hymeniacidonis]